MKITHFCNSFIAVEEGPSRLVCDPWVGTCNYGGWLSFPIARGGGEILRGLAPTHLYISHLHQDHLCAPLLAWEGLRDTPVFIKAFADRRLLGRLRDLGLRRVIELEPWEPRRISEELEIVIVPADSSNVEGLKDDVDYDLDTSVLVRSAVDGTTFFNRVDNPISLAQHRRVREFAAERWPGARIDAACLPVGASSEYPQCFLGVDREEEKRKVIDSSLRRFAQQLEALDNRIFFPAGGSYVIPGKFSPLNRYIAQPSLGELEEVVAASPGGRRFFHIEGGDSIERVGGAWRKVDGGRERYATRESAIAAHRDLVYDYARAPDSERRSNAELFALAERRYREKLESLSIRMDWRLEFRLYDDLRVDGEGRVAEGVKPRETFVLGGGDAQEPPPYSLSCHLDARLFRGLLTREYLWNMPVSGSLILYERVPNTFVPSITFSLNYLTI